MLASNSTSRSATQTCAWPLHALLLHYPPAMEGNPLISLGATLQVMVFLCVRPGRQEEKELKNLLNYPKEKDRCNATNLSQQLQQGGGR